MISSPSFQRLVEALKKHKKTITVIESSCGGLINASILSQPGASSVYYGGSIAYNTKKSKPLLLNNTKLHTSLLNPPPISSSSTCTKSSTSPQQITNKKEYIHSKLHWTEQTSIAFGTEINTDYCIAEGGATGPTFRPKDLHTGFAVIAIAAKKKQSSSSSSSSRDDDDDGQKYEMIAQQVIESSHADREANMRLFADRAAEIALQQIIVDSERRGEEQTPATTTASIERPNDDDRSDDLDNDNDKNKKQTKTQHPYFDRATHLRTETDQLDRLAREARYVVIYGNKALFKKQEYTSNGSTEEEEEAGEELRHNRELNLLTQSEIKSICDSSGGSTSEITFLGLLNGKEPIFGADLKLNEEVGEQQSSATSIETTILQSLDSCGSSSRVAKESIFEDIRTVAPLLDDTNTCHNEMVIHATALAQWQRRSKFCPLCGSSTILEQGGTTRTCTGCGTPSWPRQDPSMIAVVSNRDGSKVLLGRSKRHPTKMHTALAGFVEAGETMERAVAREVYEETGIRVDEDTVQYVASQPWPFPQSTMIGFTVKADDKQPLNIDTNELVDAKWFDKSQVLLASGVLGPVMQKEVAEDALRKNPQLTLLIPPKGVLARTLIDTWMSSSSG